MITALDTLDQNYDEKKLEDWLIRHVKTTSQMLILTLVITEKSRTKPKTTNGISK